MTPVMTPEQVALELLKVAIAAGGGIVELVTEQERKSLEQRIERALAAVKDPIDTTEEDASRRARLEAVLRGEGDDVSVVVNGRPTRLPARAAYEQLVAAAGMSGQPTVVVRGAGSGRTVTPGQVVDLAAGATVNVAHTSNA
ncbi:MAG: hypothetical protein SangKO_011570 [Sandaracinaceae bacterium]